MTRRAWLAVLLAAVATRPVLAGPVGSIFAVNTYTTGTQDSPVATSDAAGNVTVAWVSQADGAQDGDEAGVFARCLDSNGMPFTAELAVNTYTTGSQYAPALAGTPAGDFVVVWQSDAQDGDVAGVFGRRFASDGTPLGAEFQVNTYTTGAQHEPAVGVATGGGFVVAWTSDGQDGDGAGVFAQRFDASGTPLGSEFQVNTYTTSDQDQPSVAVLPSGAFFIAWTSTDQGQMYPALRGVYGQLYDTTGLPIGSEVAIFDAPFEQSNPVVLAEGGVFSIVSQHYTVTGGQLVVLDATGAELVDEYINYGQEIVFDDSGNLLLASPGLASAWWVTNPFTIYSAGEIDGPAAILTSSGLGGALLGAVAAFGDQEFVAIGSNGDLIGRRFTNCRDPGFGPPCSDHPVTGRRVAISKRFPGKVKFVSKDPAFPFPAIGGPDDPRWAGMSVSLVTPERAHTFPINPAPYLWLPRDGVTDKYVYRNGGQAFGYRVAVKILEGRGVTVRIPDPIALVPPIGTLGVRIQLGDTRMCALFDAPTVRSETSEKFTAVDAPVGGLTDCSDQSLGLL